MNVSKQHSLEIAVNSMTAKPRAPARHLRSVCTALLLGVALTATNGAQAQYAVYDGANWFENLWTKFQTSYARIEATAEYAKDELRWMEQLKRYSDALVTINGQINSFGLPAAAPLTRVPDNYLVLETCGTGDLSLTGLFKTFVYKPEGDWRAQQREICVNIRTMRNRKFNESLEFAGGTLEQMQKALEAISTLRTASNLLGNVTAVDSDSLRAANDISVKVQQWEARMKSYDAYIEVMEENQRVVAALALKGDPNKRLIGDMVKTTILAGVLKVK